MSVESFERSPLSSWLSSKTQRNAAKTSVSVVGVVVVAVATSCVVVVGEGVVAVECFFHSWIHSGDNPGFVFDSLRSDFEI